MFEVVYGAPPSIPSRDLTGRRFGRLLVVSQSDINNRQRRWNCLCDCGKAKIAVTAKLLNGNVKSCGCLRADTARNRMKTHGATGTPTYRRWKGMLARCNNPNIKAYPDYGGRGIKVCNRWLNSFENFFADMGECPSDAHTIERNENNKNYEPGNCCWATRKEQNRNTRRNHFFEIGGARKTLGEWCEIYGAEYSITFKRINRGWKIERALTAPHRDEKSCLHGISSSTPCTQCEQEIEVTA